MSEQRSIVTAEQVWRALEVADDGPRRGWYSLEWIGEQVGERVGDDGAELETLVDRMVDAGQLRMVDADSGPWYSRGERPADEIVVRDHGREQERADNAAQLEAQLSGFARLGALIRHRADTDFPDQLDRHIQEREQLERDGVLSVEVERTVRVVLCTGGPHCEVRWPEGGNPVAVCFGWFGAGKAERELSDEEVAGLEYALGDWDTLALVDSDR